MTTLFGKDRVQSNQQIKKYTALFGSLFSDLHIQRKSEDITQLVRVPIKYGPGQLRNKTEAIDGQTVKTNLVYPAMAFEFKGMTKATNRMTNPYIKVRKGSPEPGEFNEKFSKAPVPYNFHYTLTIRTKNAEDMNAILEQIVSVFNPQVSIRIIDNNVLGLERDVTVILTSESYDYEDNYESSTDEQRIIEVTLAFDVQGYMYKYAELKPVLMGVTYNPESGDYDIQGVGNEGVDDYTIKGTIDNIGVLMSNSTRS